MQRFILWSITIALLITSRAAAQSPSTKLLDDRVAIEQWLKEQKVPALGIGIIRDAQLREIRMYGELKSGSPAPYNAIFNVASLTKPVTAMLALKLVNRGQWDLDEPLYKYWVDPDVANDPRHKLLTTRIILSHQTGFKNWRYLYKDKKLAFDTTPGTKFGYSGEGFEYLARALEKKFNLPLAKLTDSIIFRPLGMTDTRHTWDASTDEARFAHWFDRDGHELTQNYKKTIPSAADDLLTTIEDYGRFAADVLQGAGLDTALFNQFIRPHVPTKGGLYMCLGWELFLHLGPAKEYAITHSGSDGGVQALVILLPVSKQGLIIFTNSDNGYKLYEKLITELLDTGKEMMQRVK